MPRTHATIGSQPTLTELTMKPLDSAIDMPSNEEIRQLVTFSKYGGKWYVNDVLGRVRGNVKGSVLGSIDGRIEGSVSGSIEGSVSGRIKGDVKGDILGNVWGEVKGKVEGRKWHVPNSKHRTQGGNCAG